MTIPRSTKTKFVNSNCKNYEVSINLLRHTIVRFVAPNA